MQSISPWYKQVWPWVLILIPFTSVIMGGVIMYVSTSGKDSLVIDDYYKQGKAINVQLDKIERAKRLSIGGKMSVTDTQVVFLLDQNAQHDGTALGVNFFHSTLEERDFEVKLTHLGNNRYQANLPQGIDTNGKWRVTMMPFTLEWKVQFVVTLPRQDAFEVYP